MEGIRLTFESTGREFSEEVGGRVMFLTFLPENTLPEKDPPQKAVPEPAEPRSK